MTSRARGHVTVAAACGDGLAGKEIKKKKQNEKRRPPFLSFLSDTRRDAVSSNIFYLLTVVVNVDKCLNETRHVE